MRQSLETAAHVTTVVEVDMTGIVDMRTRWKAEYKTRHGVNLTYIPFVALATLDAISQWPWINAEVQGETAIIKHYVNLGMAVAVDDSKGLMVPVIRGADEKNLLGLSRSVVELAEKARGKTLTPDEMSGGTFTITNPGVFGALIGTPIIPEGQVAILDVEAIVKRPVVVTDEHGNDAIAIRSMMFLCLSYDHRLVDGAYAAQFMAQLERDLETCGRGLVRAVNPGVRREPRGHAVRHGAGRDDRAGRRPQPVGGARHGAAARARAGDHPGIARRSRSGAAALR